MMAPILGAGKRLLSDGNPFGFEERERRPRRGRPTRVTYEYGDRSAKPMKDKQNVTPTPTKKTKPVTQPETTDTYAR